MIEAYTGLPGMGKTATLAKIGYNAMREGRTVYTNFPLKGAIPYHDLVEVLFTVKNALIIVDEAGLILDQLKMFEMPYELFYALRQHRKDGLDLYLSAQSLLDIAYVFRRLIQFENRITMKLGRFIYVSVRDPQPAGSQFGKRILYLSDWVFKIYRTEFKVKPPEYLGMNANGELLDLGSLRYDTAEAEREEMKKLLTQRSLFHV